MATVIDQLIVKLGLNPEDFTKGEKQVAASVLDLQSKVKKSTDSMGSDFVSFTKKLIGITTVIAVVNKSVGAILRMSTEIRDLGRNSHNLGMSAADLRNFGNALEALGGNSKDALSDIEAFQKSLFNLEYMGEYSPQLEMLTRLEVQFQDATGAARDFGAVAQDAGAKVRELVQSGQMTRANAIFSLKQALGPDDALAAAALDNTLAAEIVRQKTAHKQLNRGTVAEATSLEKNRVEMHQSREDVAITTMRDAEKAAEALEKVTDKLTDAFTRVINWIDSKIPSDAKTAATLPGGEKDHYTAKAGEISPYAAPRSAYPSDAAYEAAQKDPSKMLVKNSSGKFVPLSSLSAADQAAARPRNGILGWLQRKSAETQAQWEADKAPGGKYGTPIKTASPLDFAKGATASPSPATKAGDTTIYVGPVTVTTAAKDADGIASDMAGAVTRKMNAAQAEPGLH